MSQRAVSEPGYTAYLRQAREGDAAAMRALLASFWPNAYRIAYSVVQRHHLAEDAAQEASARILTSLGSLRSDEAFAAWARRIVVNEACQVLRGTWRELPGVPLTERMQIEVPSEDGMTLDEALASLAEAYRVPLVLRYYHGLSSSEIGAALGLPAGTVRSRLMEARSRLRGVLATEGPHFRPDSTT